MRLLLKVKSKLKISEHSMAQYVMVTRVAPWARHRSLPAVLSIVTSTNYEYNAQCGMNKLCFDHLTVPAGKVCRADERCSGVDPVWILNAVLRNACFFNACKAWLCNA